MGNQGLWMDIFPMDDAADVSAPELSSASRMIGLCRAVICANRGIFDFSTASAKQKIVIFCDSEFFHGKDWDDLKKQLQRGKNADFWIKKISRNRERDEEINKQLMFLGWTVIRFWGKDIKKDVDQCVKVVEETIFENTINEEDILD